VNSALGDVLRRTDLQDHLIGYDETRQWPALEREAVFGLGILRQIEDAEFVPCDACPEPHDVEVILGMGAEPRVYCGEAGLGQIRRERLFRWQVDFESMAQLIARTLDTGVVQQLASGRIWLLGRRQVADRTAEFFLVNGIAWEDGVEILRATPRLQNSPAPVILCPDRLPQDSEWHQKGRALFRLTELARITDSRLVIEIGSFEDLYRQIAASAEEPLKPTPIPDRPQVLKDFCLAYPCPLKDFYFWAHVAREDLNKWKLGRPQIPDHSEKAIRIERLLQRKQKTRTK
jgi:hypothetical protein